MASLHAEPVLSARSGRVKAARRLARRASRGDARRFLVEGPQAVREALKVRDGLVEVFAVDSVPREHPDLARSAAAQGVAWRRVDEGGLASLADTVHPQGVVAVCRYVDVPLDAALARRPSLVVVCADVRDPGNAGTVIRCADAAGAGALVLTGHSVDPYNGKAVRASAGSLFHLPVVVDPDTTAVLASLREAGLQVLAADGAGDHDLELLADTGELAGPTAWLFGNEAWGLPEETAALADRRVRIPIHGHAESLNLATAAAVCLYTSAREQRRPSRSGGPTRSPDADATGRTH
jgi:TrmH family RNA methyltransferase